MNNHSTRRKKRPQAAFLQILGHMRECYIGVDPGAKGYVVVYNAISKQFGKYPLSGELLVDFLTTYATFDAICVIEKVHAMPGQGRSSCFTFGYNTGRVVGIIEALGIPYTMVTPQTWQREMWDSGDKVMQGKKVDNKRTSYNAARRLHPKMLFTRTERCKTFDDDLVDATLICDYAIRKNL